MGKRQTTYTNESIWAKDTPKTYEELLEDQRFQKMSALSKDAVAAKFLNMTYGQYQSFKISYKAQKN